MGFGDDFLGDQHQRDLDAGLKNSGRRRRSPTPDDPDTAGESSDDDRMRDDRRDRWESSRHRRYDRSRRNSRSRDRDSDRRRHKRRRRNRRSYSGSRSRTRSRSPPVLTSKNLARVAGQQQKHMAAMPPPGMPSLETGSLSSAAGVPPFLGANNLSRLNPTSNISLHSSSSRVPRASSVQNGHTTSQRSFSSSSSNGNATPIEAATSPSEPPTSRSSQAPALSHTNESAPPPHARVPLPNVHQQSLSQSPQLPFANSSQVGDGAPQLHSSAPHRSFSSNLATSSASNAHASSVPSSSTTRSTPSSTIVPRTSQPKPFMRQPPLSRVPQASPQVAVPSSSHQATPGLSSLSGAGASASSGSGTVPMTPLPHVGVRSSHAALNGAIPGGILNDEHKVQSMSSSVLSVAAAVSLSDPQEPLDPRLMRADAVSREYHIVVQQAKLHSDPRNPEFDVLESGPFQELVGGNGVFKQLISKMVESFVDGRIQVKKAELEQKAEAALQKANMMESQIMLKDHRIDKQKREIDELRKSVEELKSSIKRKDAQQRKLTQKLINTNKLAEEAKQGKESAQENLKRAKKKAKSAANALSAKRETIGRLSSAVHGRNARDNPMDVQDGEESEPSSSSSSKTPSAPSARSQVGQRFSLFTAEELASQAAAAEAAAEAAAAMEDEDDDFDPSAGPPPLEDPSAPVAPAAAAAARTNAERPREASPSSPSALESAQSEMENLRMKFEIESLQRRLKEQSNANVIKREAVANLESNLRKTELSSRCEHYFKMREIQRRTILDSNIKAYYDLIKKLFSQAEKKNMKMPEQTLFERDYIKCLNIIGRDTLYVYPEVARWLLMSEAMSDAMEEAKSNEDTMRGLLDGSFCVFQKDIVSFLRGWIETGMPERFFAIFANERHEGRDALQQVLFIFDKQTKNVLRYDPSATEPNAAYKRMFDETFSESVWTLNHWTEKHQKDMYEVPVDDICEPSVTSWVTCIRFLCGLVDEAETEDPTGDHGPRYIERFTMQGNPGPQDILFELLY